MHASSLVVGNSIWPLATEYYNLDGELVATEYQIWSRRFDRRKEFFHPFHRDFGVLARNGWGTIAEGIMRLLNDEFPIDVVLHHLLQASGSPYDVEAEHLVLAIHTAVEGWNRLHGVEEWLDKKTWGKFARKLRKTLKTDPLWETLCEQLQDNVRGDLGRSNRTTMGWRQNQLFSTLQIDVSDDDNTRALGLRNHLLHNGYFVERWRHLGIEQRQQRLDDISRLRRLTLLIVFKLAGYSGDFRSPVTHMAERVDAPDLSRFPPRAPDERTAAFEELWRIAQKDSAGTESTID